VRGQATISNFSWNFLLHFEDGDYILDGISHLTLKRIIHLHVSRPPGHQEHDWIKGGKKLPALLSLPIQNWQIYFYFK